MWGGITKRRLKRASCARFAASAARRPHTQLAASWSRKFYEGKAAIYDRICWISPGPGLPHLLKSADLALGCGSWRAPAMCGTSYLLFCARVQLCGGMRGSNSAGGGLKSSIFSLCVKSWMPRVVDDFSQKTAAAPPPTWYFGDESQHMARARQDGGAGSAPSPPHAQMDAYPARPKEQHAGKWGQRAGCRGVRRTKL